MDDAAERSDSRAGPVPEVRSIEGPVSLAGAVFSVATVLRAGGSGDSGDSGAEIVSFADAVLVAPVHIGEGIDLRGCDFRGAVGLEHLRFARSPFGRGNGRFVLEHETGPVCRQLRAAAAASGLHDLAADLHIGELEAARRAAPTWSTRRSGLEFYRLVGGYGHRPSRPLAAYVVMISFVTWLFHRDPEQFVGGDRWIGNHYIDYPHWPNIMFKLLVRISLTPLSPIDPTDMHNDGFALLMSVKLATVLLIVFTGMGLRSRLRR